LNSVDATTGSEPPPRAAQWFQSPIQTIPVTTLGPFSATADGACPVQFGTSDRGYVKPRPDAEKNIIVAREKIASDLGYLLGLPVATVIIRTPGPDLTAWPHHSAMSAANPVARAWGDGGVAHLATAAEQLERLRTFWTWIRDSDHNGHPQNLVYSLKSGRCDVLAIDHSHSLCHGNTANSLAVSASQGYGTVGMPGCADWTRAEIDNIMSLEWAKVEDLVRRLRAVIRTTEQDKILQILRERRANLGHLLGI
jgi:hypothetical protein